MVQESCGDDNGGQRRYQVRDFDNHSRSGWKHVREEEEKDSEEDGRTELESNSGSRSLSRLNYDYDIYSSYSTSKSVETTTE